MSFSRQVRLEMLLQSKIGRIERLKISDGREYRRLLEQIKDMRALTRHPKVMEISTENGDIPTVVSATGVLEGHQLRHYRIGDWIAKRVLPTFDGDKNPEFVEKVL